MAPQTIRSASSQGGAKLLRFTPRTPPPARRVVSPLYTVLVVGAYWGVFAAAVVAGLAAITGIFTLLVLR